MTDASNDSNGRDDSIGRMVKALQGIRNAEPLPRGVRLPPYNGGAESESALVIVFDEEDRLCINNDEGRPQPSQLEGITGYLKGKVPGCVVMPSPALAAEQARLDAEEEFTREEGPAHDPGAHRPSIADRLISLVPDALLFVALDDEKDRDDNDKGRVFVEVNEGGVRELHALRSTRVRRWLMRRYQAEAGRAANADALKQAIDTVEGRGFARSIPRHVVYCRTARIDGTIWIDLCNANWQAIKVTNAGWEVADTPPVRFRRGKGMQALPTPVRPAPVRGDDLLETPETSLRRGRLAALENLRSLLNLRADENGDADFVMVVGWLLMALGGLGPYPLMVFTGEHGTAKSTSMRILRAMSDPHEAGLRSPPQDKDALRVAAANSFVLAFDNLSYLPVWLSDALCRISTGAADGKREHYADLEEIIVKLLAPVMLNGIDEFVKRPDLASRSIFALLNPIPETDRVKESTIGARIAQAAPVVLGALLDGLSEGLRRENTAPLALLPRMADFAQWVSDCETAFWTKGEFTKAYEQNRKGALAALLEGSILATVLRRWLAGLEGDRWEGAPADLHAALIIAAQDRERALREWPKAANRMSDQLTRIAPALREIGVEVVQSRSHGENTVRLQQTNWVRPERAAGEATAPDGPLDQDGDPGAGVDSRWH
jgi:hypothetical protein